MNLLFEVFGRYHGQEYSKRISIWRNLAHEISLMPSDGHAFHKPNDHNATLMLQKYFPRTIQQRAS